MTPPRRIVVVGGGIAGLAAAHRLVELSRERREPVEITLLEARNRLGGTIATERVGGFLIEAGPDSFLSEKPWALALSERLGITRELVRTDDRFRKTFVVHRGKLHPLPEGFQLLAPARLASLVTSRLFSWPGKLRMALDLLLPRRAGSGDESLGSFVRRRLGAEALERVAQPLVAGIYTAEPDQLSLAATMPRFLEMERRERSLILALWRQAHRGQTGGVSGARWSLFVTFAQGMETLISALAGRLPAGAVRLRAPVAALARSETRWTVVLASGEALPADGVVLAPESHQSARLLRDLDPRLAQLLGEIPYASSATVSLGYRREAIPRPLDGFGFVVPRSEGRPILACTFGSVKYPGRAPEGHALLRIFLGGALDEAVLKEDDESLVAIARGQLGELLGVTGPPVLARVHRHPLSMPQYRVGHLEHVATIERCLDAEPGLKLAGSAYRGVGIADCVRSGEEAASQLLEQFGSSKEGRY